MQKWFKITYLAALLSLIMTGCELYYVPPHVQTYSFEEQGDISVNFQGLYSGSGSAAYAFSDHGFIGASVSGFADRGDSASNDFFRSTTLEGGYYNFDPEKKIRFELVGGIGNGQAGDDDFDVSFIRSYIQPGVGFFSESRIIENHLNFRISHLAYDKQTTPQTVNAFGATFFEPTYSFRAGSPNLKFHLQMGLSIPVYSESGVPSNFAYTPVIMSVGLNANFNVFGQKRSGTEQ